MNHICRSIGSNGEFEMSVIFEKEAIDLTVYKMDEAWNTRISKLESTPLSTKHGHSLQDYYSTLENYIRTSPSNVELNFIPDQFTVNLILKNKMKKLYFSVILQKMRFGETMINLLQVLARDKKAYFDELGGLRGQYAAVLEENTILERKLEQFLQRKQSDELDLYNHFIGLLNEKKRHIQHLNDLLMAFKQGRPTINPSLSKKQSNSKVKSKKVSESSESSSSDGYDTDEEKKVTLVKKEPSPVAGTSKMDVDFCMLPKRIRSEGDGFETVVKVEAKSFKTEETVDHFNGCSEKTATVNNATQDLLDDL